MSDLLAALDLSVLNLGFLGRLLLAAALGGVIGLEREWSGKPAGFRTNLLICLGAALLTELSMTVAHMADPGMNADPARIAAQIVSGIGFLGAGTIIQSRGSVTGLTTAATLWVVSAIGMSVGVHAYAEAIGATLLVVLALLLLGRIEPRLSQHIDHIVRVTMDHAPEVRQQVETALGMKLDYTLVEVERRGDKVVVAYEVTGRRRHWDPLVARLAALEGVARVVRG